MERTISIYLNDALFNAGILGFYRLYHDKWNEFQCYENKVQFDSAILSDFAERYLKHLQQQFQRETLYDQIVNFYSETLKHGEKYEETIKACIDKIKRLEGASYKSGYEIIKKRGCDYDFLAAIKEIPKITELETKQKALNEFVENMKAHQDIFLLKGIAYTKVNLYWESVSFFHRDAVKEEFEESIQKYFTDPAINFKPAEGKKATMTCCQCGVGLSKNESKQMAWLIDIGIDTARKTSPFWNYNVDICLCPVCALVYACMPLGFTIFRDEGIFINWGHELTELNRTNSISELVKSARQDEALNRNVLYGAMSKLLNKYQQITNQMTLNNIQVVRKNTDGYTFDMVSAEILKKISRCEKEFDFLAGNWINDIGDIYNQTINCVLRGRNLYGLIDKLLRNSIANNRRLSYIQKLILIQALIYVDDENELKGGKTPMSIDDIAKITKGRIYGARKAGEWLNKEMSSDERNSKKIRGLSFKLLNHLKTRDVHGYVDTVLRQYMSLGKPVPDFISKTLDSETIFLDCGYAFVAGLQGISVNESLKETEGGQ